MKHLARLSLALTLLMALSPLVGAQNNGEVGSGADGLTTTCVPTRELSAIAGVITATDLNACSTLPAIVHRSSLDSNGATTGYATIQGTIAVAGPNIPTGGIATYTYAFVGFAGCNTGSQAQQDDVLAAGSGSSFHYLLDMTADECHGYITVTITAGVVPVTIAHFYFPVDIRAEQTFDDTLTVTNSGTLDITDRLCAASTIGSACTTPTINEAVTGTLTLAGTLSISQSGTWTISDDAGGWAVHQDPLSGTITVNGIPDTQSEIEDVATAISSLNRLRVQICGDTGDIEAGACNPLDANIHQDQACGATFATRCYGELSGININQTVGNVTVPSNFTLNGGSIPIQVGSETGDFFVPVFLWIIALVVFLRIAKLMAAGASTVGLGFSILFPGDFGWQIFALLLLGIALWLEATARERIYARFFRAPSLPN